ncbi:hypothetical protein M433DRAFT_61526 [Acidomyces richmondensis BFW]|nr:MAG: hypothetical protein FE78DRAFT_138213 [Acidomyces sp. 'richmondensis']KYG48263.1 hypothetical protein M433DRAFT_61526 [Acidomyces richmondensis BFW]
MRLFCEAALTALSFGSVVWASSAWSFEDATVSIQGKGSGVGGGMKEKLNPHSPLVSSIPLPAAETLKVTLTALEGKNSKRPHQAFLTLQDPNTGLEDSFPFTMKENGKGKVEITQKELPYQFVTSDKPLKASVILASFGTSNPYNNHAFDLIIQTDPVSPPIAPAEPERYVAKPEIHHIFKSDPRTPPKIISLFFVLAILGTLPMLFGIWLFLGANMDHVGKAFSSAPISHGLFLGSIIAMEGVFFMYYTFWNLFQTLPIAALVGAVAYISGSRALTEVQERRLAGER